jgi:hypothetical protein
MLKNYINSKAQEFRKREIYREKTYFIIDPTAVNDKIREIVISIYIFSINREIERRLIICWKDSKLKVFEKVYKKEEIEKDWEKYNNKLKLINDLIEKDKLEEAEEKSIELLKELEKETEKIVEEIPGPIPTTLAKKENKELFNKILHLIRFKEDPDTKEKFEKIEKDDIFEIFKEKGYSDEEISSELEEIKDMFQEEFWERRIKENLKISSIEDQLNKIISIIDTQIELSKQDLTVEFIEIMKSFYRGRIDALNFIKKEIEKLKGGAK